MSLAGRKPSPDQMANLFRRMMEGTNPRDGHPYLPTDDEFRAATGWFQLDERVRPKRSWRQITRPPYTLPSPGPAVEPEPVEESPEPEPAPVETSPAPAKRKSRFRALEFPPAQEDP